MPTLLLALLGLAPAAASTLLEGDVFDVYMNDYGTWNDDFAGAGLQITVGGTTYEATYAGTPFQLWALAYDVGDESVSDYAISSGYFTSGDSSPDTNLSVEGEEDLSTATLSLSRYSYTDGVARIVQLQGFPTSSAAMGVLYLVSNEGSEPLSSLRLGFLFDPDQDYDPDVDDSYGTVNTVNDGDGDGTDDAVVAAGPTSGVAVALTACDQELTTVGVDTYWYAEYSADLTLSATGATGDYGVGAIVTLDEELAPGETAAFRLVVSAGASADEALEVGADSLGLCDLCDVDGDGARADYCDGDDCDDADPSRLPGGEEVWYDGTDGDCAGGDDYDQDGDGHDASDYGGDDCDDTNPDALPGGEDAWYDGTDGDCDGASDYDQDGDGHDASDYGGDDCDDTDTGAYPGAPEVSDDGVDQDCDGEDLTASSGDDSGGDDSGGGDSGGGNDSGGGDDSGEGDSGGEHGDEVDSGGSKDKDGGCSCTSAPGSGSAGAGLALAAVVLLRRRARR